jgi:hypothetical protein
MFPKGLPQAELERVVRALSGRQHRAKWPQDLRWADTVLRDVEKAIGETPIDEIEFVVKAPSRKGRA